MRNSTGNNIMMILAILLLLITSGCQSGGISIIAQLSFFQLSFHLDDIEQNDSSWGAVELEFDSVPDHPILYFNLAVDDEQVIKNMPLLCSEVEGVPNKLWIHFPLDVPEGKKLDTIKYGYSLSTSPMNSTPTSSTSSAVLSNIVLMSSGSQYESWRNIVMSANRLTWSPIVDWAKHPRDKVVNQDCGLQECFPTAVSNSLKMLKKLHPEKLAHLTDDPGNDNDDTDIKQVIENITFIPPYVICTDPDTGEDDIGGGTNSVATTADPIAPWNEKKGWMDKDSKYPIETTIIDDFSQLDQLIRGLKDKCDVEFIAEGHAVMITGCLKLENGTYLFEYGDDTEQDVAGGTKTSYFGYNSKTKDLFGNPMVEGQKYIGPNKSEPLFMIECVK